jgi:microcin C transport system permease protein
MFAYFIRRFLLMFPTLIGATFAVYFITRIAPGGPAETMMRQALAMGAEKSTKDAGASLSEAQKDQIRARFKQDQPYWRGYLMWLGVIPDEVDKRFFTFEPGKQEAAVTLKYLLPKEQWQPNNAYRVVEATVSRSGKLKEAKTGKTVAEWTATITDDRAAIFRRKFEGLLQGQMGESLRYAESVWGMIVRRMPISLFYGLLSFLIAYSISLPLGVLKAIRHRTLLDTGSSLIIFIAYAIPSFVLGSLLVVFPAARWGWFPASGFKSENFTELSLLGKVADLFHHGALPLCCYLIGSFAMLTLMMKNSLMDNLAADYVRTAMAKGSNFTQAVLRHALRNSFIPLASSLGGIIMVFVGGSVLIENIFDIDGMGRLHFQALQDRDIILIMGLLTVDVVLVMLGNILSDLFVALTDPRIRFD